MATAYPLTLDHLQAFGAIIQQFARFERLVEITIGGLLGVDYGLAAVTVAGLGYNAKCDALLSLVAVTSIPKEQKTEISRHLKAFNHRAGLRNSIAHNIWREGKYPGSIKPMSVTARGGNAKVRGLKDDENEYTEVILFKIANDLNGIHNDFRAFLLEVGFIVGNS